MATLNNGDFKGQVAVVTGAASGIGLAIAKKLLNEGATIAVFDINRVQLETEFGNDADASIYPIDITRQADVESAVREIFRKYGQVDILVNCAGITGPTEGLTHEVNTDDLRKVFELNFFSCFFTSRAVLPYMLKRNYGRILHIASIAGKEGNARMLAYSASKAALIGMTKVQGKEYAETGITINALAPAVIRTPLVEKLSDERIKYMTDKIPMKRCGTLEEASDMALFIISVKNSFTTGFTFDLTGGRATY
jgi:2-dehydro-3-deoxy-L-rhamnonate dehydrogenase (NAD+)